MDDFVVNVLIQNFRNKVCSDTLDFMRARLAASQNWRSRRFYRVHLDVRIFLFQHFTSACNRSACPDTGDESIQGTADGVDRFHDFRSGRFAVNLHVRRVLELLGYKVARVLSQNGFGFLDRAVHSFRSRCQYQLRAVSAQQVAALQAHRFRHNDDCFVALRCRYHRKTDTSVAACRFQNCISRLQTAVILGFFHDADRDTVFNARTRILILQLHINFRCAFRYDPVQTNKRCSPDKFSYIINDFGHEQKPPWNDKRE
ncbi:hypothetical protein D3C71_1425130 [compost metagenome]